MSLMDDWESDAAGLPPIQPMNPFADAPQSASHHHHHNPPVPAYSEGPDERAAASPFSLVRCEWQPPLNDAVRCVVASNNVLVVACTNAVHIVDAITWEGEVVELGRSSAVHKAFIDPTTGRHVLVCMQNGDNYYINTSTLGKPKPIFTRQKGLMLECVAWVKTNTTSGGGEVLIGSLKGAIWHATFMDGKDKTLRQVYVLGERMPVFGLQFESFPGQSAPASGHHDDDGADGGKFFVMATTRTQASMRLYQFVGQGNVGDMFAQYTQPEFTEMPGVLEASELHFFSKYQGVAKSFAWLTDQGIYYGDLAFAAQVAHDTVADDCSLLVYPPPSAAGAGSAVASFSKTDFHFVLLVGSAVVAVNQVTEQCVWSMDLGKLEVGRGVGVVRDVFDSKVYVFTEGALLEVLVEDEGRDMWKVYLKKNDFDTAIAHCKTAAQKERVWSAKADHYFGNGKFDMAAQFYALTSQPFEEVALRFVNPPARDALKTYLLRKLENIPDSQVTQQMVVCTWVVEVFLNKLNALAHGGQNEQYAAVKDDLEEFLEKWAAKERLHKQTMYDLINSQGRDDVLLFFASQINDYHRVVLHHINHQQWDKALDALVHQTKSEADSELWYRFSPVLIEHEPSGTVDGWLACLPLLTVRRLLPSLMKYSPRFNRPGDNEHHGIRFLQESIARGVKEQAVHNYVLALHAKQPDDEPLMQFLQDMDPEHVDLKYALRVCMKEGKLRACVYLYMAMDMYDEAVELALKYATEAGDECVLAKECADGPVDDDSLRKKLWLRIAKHVVDQSDHSKAIEFLKECPLLSIEDILPFFPDFVRIDLFKDEVCASLQQYNNQIKALKQDMDEATNNANQIRSDISELRNRHTFLSANQKCELSWQPVIGHPFYCFPCHHVFLQSCLVDEVIPHLPEAERAEVLAIQRQLEQNDSQPEEAQMAQHELQEKKRRLDDIVARECPLCGSIMIERIDKALDEGDDDDWKIDAPRLPSGSVGL